MIGDLKPYEEYKESGLPWLGQVPGHWEVKRPKQIGDLLKGIGGTKEDSRSTGIPCVRYGELYTTHHYFIRRPKAFIETTRVSAYTPIRHGDVLFAASGEKLDEIGKSAVNLIDGLAVCGGDTIVLRPRIKVYPPYLGYAFDCRPSVIQKASMGRGTTVKHIYPDELKQLQIPLPPPEEQAAIVRFLDWANGRLERAIRAKRKVIALLNEQKQASIHRAVTRGLDPSVPLKDSGVPWLGEIPAHWEVKRLGALLRERGEGNDHGEVSHVLSLLRGRGVIPYDEKGNIGNKKSEDITRYKIVRSDDIVMNCMNVIIGSVGISRYTGCLSPVYYVLVRRNDSDSPSYLNAIFQCSAFHKSLVRIGNGILAHRMRIPMELLKCELLPYPPCAEQALIIEGLRSTTEAFDNAISRLEREITLLREYRTRLVADVVTGKLDVREAATLLPAQELLSDLVSTDEQDDDLPIEEEDEA